MWTHVRSPKQAANAIYHIGGTMSIKILGKKKIIFNHELTRIFHEYVLFSFFITKNRSPNRSRWL